MPFKYPKPQKPHGKPVRKVKKKIRRGKRRKKDPKEFLVARLSLEQQIDLLIDMSRGHNAPESEWFYHKLIDDGKLLMCNTVEETKIMLRKAWKYGILEEEDIRQEMWYAYYAKVIAKGHPKCLQFMVMSGYLTRLIAKYRIHLYVNIIENNKPTGLPYNYIQDISDPITLRHVVLRPKLFDQIYREQIIRDFIRIKVEEIIQ